MNSLKASIDIGSNSILLLVAEVSTHGLIEKLKRSEVTSLGKDLDKTKVFSKESMALTEEAIDSYVQDVLSFGLDPQNIIITATEASRVAKNAREFFDRIELKFSIKILIISSEAEAYFSAKGILLDPNLEPGIITILDVGGASSELIHIDSRNFTISNSISLPIGSVRASQWLDENFFVQNLQKIFLDFRNELDHFQTKKIVCVAGTMTSLANMHLGNKEFHENEVHRLNLKVDDIDQLFKSYSEFTADKFLEIYPFLGRRSRSIKGGLHLVYHLFHRLFVKDIMISTYGLRYGTIIEGEIRAEHLHG